MGPFLPQARTLKLLFYSKKIVWLYPLEMDVSELTVN